VVGDSKNQKVPRQAMPQQDPEVRKKNFNEVPLGYSSEAAQLEAHRCLQCKKPKCVLGCPVSIDIPGFIKCIAEGDFEGSAKKLKEKTCLPAVCGRVCPQEDQCESACVVGIKDKPVAIGYLERFASDWERFQKKILIPKKKPATGKKIAVVGSGPAGITVAGDLIIKGHDVTIFEAFHKPGGVLIYGIPEFRLPKEIVETEIAYLKKIGVKIECNSVIGRIESVDELLKEGFDAVFIGVGAGLPMFMSVPGENLCGIYSANEYLTRANLMKAYLFPNYDTPIAKGKDVCVIGAGNVAIDAARTALRLGAERVQVVYRRSRKEMPAREEEIHHAEEEGILFHVLTSPTRFIGSESGWVTGMECVNMQLGDIDESGSARPVPIKGSEHVLKCDLVVVAIGSSANPLLTATTPDLNTNKRGYITADLETGKTSKQGVWAGGDIVTGAATVILAMGAGRKAADSIHEYLTS